MSFGTHELASLFLASSLTYLYSLESVTRQRSQPFDKASLSLWFPTPRQNLTFMRLGVRTSERRCAGVTRASATSGLRWIDCGRKEH